MNEQEAIQICRLAKAASPAQSVDEYTPDLWAMVLKSVTFADAKQALVEIAGEQEWVHVSHIKARVKRIRRDRLSEFGPMPDPPGELSNEEQKQWLRETERAVADGVLTERPALPPVAVRPLPDFSNVFRSIEPNQEAS